MTVYAPTGLMPVRSQQQNGPNFGPNLYYIKQGYATAIGLGDLVYTGASASQGYVVKYTAATAHTLGVFAGLAGPYYDTVLQQSVNKQFWAGTESASQDVACWVYDDPFMVYSIQVSGGPLLYATDRGNNAEITDGGVNTATGLSRMGLLYSSVNTTATLPLRIVGTSQQAQGGIDPTASLASQILAANANNYALVKLNTSEMLTALGI